MAHRPIGILLVDARPEFLQAACAWLDREPGVQVVGTARTGAEAIVAAKRLAPDLVLMDTFMPGLDGFETTTAIKNALRPPIVVLLTMHSDEAIETEAWAAGADGVIPKSEFSSKLPVILRNYFGVAATATGE